MKLIVGTASISLALLSGEASATGISAGTLIQNSASASYSTGATTGSVQSNIVTVRVDEVLDVAVAGLSGAPTVIGSANGVLSWSVTNTGNGPEAFLITLNPAVAGNPFDAVVQALAIDSNGNNSYDAGVDQVLANGAATPALPADASLRVFALVSLPASAGDGQTSQLRLTAAAQTGTGSPGRVFAGSGAGGGDAVVGSSGASASALETITASLAAVALTKSAVIADPFGGSQPVPGAIITYTILATASGSGQVANLRVTDPIPAGTTYRSGTLRLDAAALSDANDADAGTASASGIDVNLGTVSGGSTRSVKFDVSIN